MIPQLPDRPPQEQTPVACLRHLLRAAGLTPPDQDAPGWAGIQADPYLVRRWRDQLAGFSTPRLHRFARTVAGQIAAADGQRGPGTEQRRELLAQAIAADHELAAPGRLGLSRPSADDRSGRTEDQRPDLAEGTP